MKKWKVTLLSLLMACAVLFAPFASIDNTYQITTVNAEESATDYSTKYVVLSLEGFTIGQGFYILPQRMSYKEIGEVWAAEGVTLDLSKLTVSQATYAFFKKAGLSTEPTGTSGYNDSAFYLTKIAGIDKGTATISTEILTAYQRINNKALEVSANADTNLDAYDYTAESGWMSTLDGTMGTVGAGEQLVDSGTATGGTHVIRWQFSIAGWGADLTGSDWYGNTYYTVQDKTELYILYAEKADIIQADASLNQEILAVMTDIDASAADVASAKQKLIDAKATQTIESQTIYVYDTHIALNVSAVGNVTYKSSNKKVATVDENTGFVTVKKPGKTTIVVTAAATETYNEATAEITLIALPKAPTVKSLKTSGSKAIKLTYKKSSGASGYQITYSTSKTFKNEKSINVSKKKASATIKKLKKGKKYYVKIRAYKKIDGEKYYGLYSDVYTVKTE